VVVVVLEVLAHQELTECTAASEPFHLFRDQLFITQAVAVAGLTVAVAPEDKAVAALAAALQAFPALPIRVVVEAG
jgi:hypothetical protein